MTQKLTGGQLELLAELKHGPITTDPDCGSLPTLEWLNSRDLAIMGNEHDGGKIIWTITQAGKASLLAGLVLPCQHPPTRQFAGFANDENLQEILWVGCCDCGLVREFPSPFAKKNHPSLYAKARK